jgi:uncharacterized damage-inducible protein DinB
MSTSMLEDAFGHHVWATLRLIDTCLTLSPSELERAVPGTYGTILDTQRHVVGSDSWYLFDITGDRARRIEEDLMDLPELRTAMERDGEAWSALLAQDLDPDAILKDVDEDDGYERDAPIGIRMAQALHHGTDHRSQICTTLTSLGVEPPGIDVWNFGVEVGRVVDVPRPN